MRHVDWAVSATQPAGVESGGVRSRDAAGLPLLREPKRMRATDSAIESNPGASASNSLSLPGYIEFVSADFPVHWYVLKYANILFCLSV